MIQRIRIVIAVLTVMCGAIFLVYYFTVLRLRDDRAAFPYHFDILFKDVWSIYPEAKVWVHGHIIGRVDKIKLWQGYARITVIASETLPVYANYRVQINHLNLLGGYYIDLYPGSPPARKLYDSFDQRTMMGETIGDPITIASNIFNETQPLLLEITQNLWEISEKVDHSRGTVGKVMLDEETYQNLLNLFQASDVLVDDLERMLEMGNKNWQRNQMSRSVTTLGTRSLLK